MADALEAAARRPRAPAHQWRVICHGAPDVERRSCPLQGGDDRRWRPASGARRAARSAGADVRLANAAPAPVAPVLPDRRRPPATRRPPARHRGTSRARVRTARAATLTQCGRGDPPPRRRSRRRPRARPGAGRRPARDRARKRDRHCRHPAPRRVAATGPCRRAPRAARARRPAHADHRPPRPHLHAAARARGPRAPVGRRRVERLGAADRHLGGPRAGARGRPRSPLRRAGHAVAGDHGGAHRPGSAPEQLAGRPSRHPREPERGAAHAALPLAPRRPLGARERRWRPGPGAGHARDAGPARARHARRSRARSTSSPHAAR